MSKGSSRDFHFHIPKTSTLIFYNKKNNSLKKNQFILKERNFINSFFPNNYYTKKTETFFQCITKIKKKIPSYVDE